MNSGRTLDATRERPAPKMQCGRNRGVAPSALHYRSRIAPPRSQRAQAAVSAVPHDFWRSAVRDSTGPEVELTALTSMVEPTFARDAPLAKG